MKPIAANLNRLMTSAYMVSLCLILLIPSSLMAFSPDSFSSENLEIPYDIKCEPPVIGLVHTIQGTCQGDFKNKDASVYISGVSGAIKANISEGTIYGGPSHKDNVTAFFVTEDYIYFDQLEQGRDYSIRVWGQDSKCYIDVVVKTAVTDCGQCGDIPGFVDKPHVHLEPIELLAKNGNPCGPGIVMTESCNGQPMTLNKSFLNTERYIALHGNCGAGSSILPACLAYVDENCGVESEEYAFCFDYNKASGLGAGFSPGTVQFVTQVGIAGVTTLNPVKAARISWVFEHLDDYGLDIDNSTHRRALQLVSWKIINPTEPGVQAFSCDNPALPRVCTGAGDLVGWCDIFDDAIAAVPDGSEIPFLTISPSNSSALINETIQLTLQTNEDIVEISVSDGGALPVFCGASVGQGHQVIDLGGGVGQLSLTGTGLRTVELCFERPATSSLTFEAELTTLISDGSSFVIYKPQPPYEETVQPFFSYRRSVLTPKASAELEFRGDLELTCSPDIEFECIDFEASQLTNWYNLLEVTSDCGVATIENDFDPNNFVGGACPQAGTQVVTFTVTDNCGQVETCQATVTVTNDRDIIWDFLPEDVTISCSDPLPTDQATAFDNCGDVVVTFDDVIVPGNCDQSYTLLRTFTANDQCGNTAEYVQTIIVTDNTPPSFGDGSDCWPSGLATTSFQTPAEANNQFSELLFAADGRIGNNAMGGDYELSLSNVNPLNVFEQADLAWPKGQNVSFEIVYNPNASGSNRLIYTLSSGATQRVLQLNPENFYNFPLDIDAFIISTMTAANTTVSVTNVAVNGQSINQSFGHTNPGSAQSNQTVVTGTDLQGGFTITGNARFDWTGANPPSGDAMKFAFSFGKLTCAAGQSCPEDLSVDCSDPNYQTVIQNWINSVVATDDCGIATVMNDYDGSLVCGEYPITFTATDECGNASTCLATLTITGSGTPNLNVPAAPALVCGAGNNLDLINNWLASASATGLCGVLDVESDLDAQEILTALSNASFVQGSNCEATVFVTFTAQDDCGTDLETTLPISIIDNDSPTISCPADLVLECGDGNNGSLISSWLNTVTGADNCSNVVITNNYNASGFSDECGETGSQMVTFTATDACGNIATCMAMISILDTNPPVFTNAPSDITLACGSSLPPANATATDACGNADITFTDNTANGSCPSDQTVTRTFVATDDCGNQSTHTQIITIVDNEGPEFIFVPNDATFSCDETPNFGDATASDNCGDVDITVDTNEIPGSCPGNTTIIRTFTATDECGNQTQATQTVTIQDAEAPSFTFVPQDYTISCDEALVLDQATAIDNCSTPSVSVSENTSNLGCDQSYTLTRVFTATDACGTIAQATQVITVLDEDAPSFVNVPSDITFECTDPNLDNNIQAWLASASATDNCGSVEITNNYNEVTGCDQATVTFTATDDCGNTATAQATVTVEGSLTPEIAVGSGPSLVCGNPDNISILENWLSSASGTGSCGPVAVTANLTASEILMGLGDQPFGNDCLASLDVIFSAIDQCGTPIETTRTVTLTDDENPEISCPSNLVLECGEAGNESSILAWLESVTATDNCTDPTISNDYLTGSFINNCGQTGTQVVTFIASDECGNASQCTASIVILDTTPPVIINAPEDLTISCEDAIPAIPNLDAADLCSDASVSSNEITTPGSCNETFVITRTFTATDACNNTSVHTQTISVIDNEAPVFTNVPADFTVQCDETINFEDATASDNCGNVNVTVNVNEIAGSCSAERTIERVFTATDDCGNVSQATQTITVVDEENPTFTFVPEDVTLDCSDNLNLMMATADDNCGDVTVSVSESTEDQGCSQSYILTRVFTATDECGNTAQATQVVTVLDETAPVFSFVPSDITLECSEPSIENVITNWLATASASDNCGSVAISNNYDGSLDCGAYEITLTATDECGNSQTASTTLSITGSGDLVIESPDVPQLICGYAGNLQVLIDWLDGVTAVGGCGFVQVNSDKTAEEILTELNNTLIDAKGECQATVEVTFSTSDLCGEVVSKVVEVNLIDSEPPVITCPENLVIECGDVNRETLIIDWLASVIATDNCTQPTVTNTYSEFAFAPGACGEEAIQFVFFSASDECGNVSNCIATIEIVDTTPPSFTDVPADLTLSCEDVIPTSSASATDACGSANVSLVSEITTPGICISAFTIERTFVATDECGNQATHTQTITVSDEESPEFTFVPADLTLSCEDPLVREAAEAADNCGPADISVNETIEEGSCDGNYILTRVFTATDLCGNEVTSTQTITVQDNEAPEFVFIPTDFSIECDDNDLVTTIDNWLSSASATDNCGPVNVSNNYSGSTDCGLYEITFTATDECGNTDTATSSFSITGAGELEIIIPDLPEIACGSNDNLTNVENWLNEVTAVGGCGNVQVTSNLTAQEIIDLFEASLLDPKGECLLVVEVTFTTSDICGTSIEEMAELTLFDSDPPVITCPEDLVVECGDVNFDTIIANWLASVSATDNCTQATVTNTYDVNGFIFDCGATGSQVVFFAATDECGNVSNCTATINIVDTEGPEFVSVPEDLTILCDEDVPASEATAEDVCSDDVNVQVNETILPGNCEGSFTVVRTFTATDDCGNITQYTQNIAVIDNEAPEFTFIPADYTINCDETPILDDATAVDNCSDAQVGVSSTILPDNCEGSYTIVRTFTATDDCGNISSATQNISVIDEEGPVFTVIPADYTISCEEELTFDAASAADNCGVVSISESSTNTPGNCPNEFVVTRTFTATDDCGNTTTAVQTITVTDEIAPVFSFVPDDYTISCEQELVLDNATATDNCGEAVVTNSSETIPGSCDGEFTLVRTFTATDLCGNTTTAVQNITVTNEIAPQFTFVPEDYTISCEEELILELAEAIDNCGTAIVTVAENTTPGECPNEYTLLRTFTATDDCGNTNTVVQTITVTDEVSPLFTFVPADYTISCEEQLILDNATATDNCGNANVTVSDETVQGVCESEFTLVRTFTATDACGNTSSAIQTITVTDEIAPVFSFVPADYTINCDEDPLFEDAFATDNCSNATVTVVNNELQGNCVGDFIIQRTFTAVDACGNTATAVQNITVIDEEAPVFTFVPSDYTISCEQELIFDDAAALDNCGEVDITFSLETIEGECTGDFTINRIFTATDDCGNSSTAVQVISVIDETAPVFTFIPADYTISCEQSLILDDATASDNCGPVEITDNTNKIDGDCTGDFTLVRTFTATDDCGNTTTAVQTITVTDEVSPEFTFVPADYTISCEQQLIFDNASATDNCGEVEITEDIQTINGDCVGDYTLIRTFTATDDCGNTTTAVQVITVIDEIAPQFTFVPSDYTISCEQELTFDNASASDNCGEVQITENTVTIEGECVGDYILERTFTATDDCGNTTTVVQTITVTDEIAPEFTFVPADYTISCEQPLTFDDATASDNCGEVLIVDNIVTIEGNCVGDYTLIRTFTATDDCGNSTTAVQTITVTDEIAPEFTFVPSDYTISCEQTLIFEDATASDNCGEVEITENSLIIEGDCVGDYTIVRTFTATDDCGNATTAVQTITVTDEIAPEFTFVPADYTISCEQTLTFEDATASDNCGEVEITEDIETIPGACVGDYTLVRTFTATDDCGNSTTTVQTITVTDEISPEFTFIPADYTRSCNQELIFEEAEASDNCGAVTIDVTSETIQGDCVGDYIIIRTFIASDDCGNTSSATQTITVVDEIPPFFTFVPQGFTTSCDNELILDDAIAIDNCGEVTMEVDTETIEGACIGDYTLVRTFLATDDCGNTTTATQIIEVVDEDAPIFTVVPQDYTISCDEELIFEPAVAEDNCGEATVETVMETVQGRCAGESVVTRTFTATDDCGNSSMVTQTITIIDEQAPVFVLVPADYTASCDEDLILEEASATDNCGEVTLTVNSETLSGVCAGEFAIIRTFTATDDCGNSSTAVQTITVIDEEAPVFTFLPASFTASCSDNLVPGIPQATDNCGAVSFETTSNIVNGNCDGNYTITYTFVATDECGNSASATQTVTVVDNLAPVFTFVPANTLLSCDQMVPMDMAMASDNCGSVNITEESTNIPGTCDNNFTIVRTFTATDACGNISTATQLITVSDTEAPSLSSCPPLTLSVDCDGVVSNQQAYIDWHNANLSALANCATDNCGDVTVSSDFDPTVQFSCETGTASVTYTLTDDCGNSTTQVGTFTINGLAAPDLRFIHPELTMMEDGSILEVECNSSVDGWEYPIYDEGAVGLLNDCENSFDITMTQTVDGSGDCKADGYFFRVNYVWTAVDQCGNESSLSLIVNIVDTAAPTIENVPEDITVTCEQIPPTPYLEECDGDECCPDVPVIEAFDSCECPALSFEEINLGSACEGEYQILRIWTAEDNCGNITVETQTITVINESPLQLEFINPDLVNFENNAEVRIACGENGFDEPDWIEFLSESDVMATYGCGSGEGVEVTYFDFLLEQSNNCQVDGFKEKRALVWTARDACGNIADLTINLTLQDTIAPIIEGLEVACSEDDAIVFAEDACGGQVFLNSFDMLVPASCDPSVNDVMRMWEASDDCGNTTLFEQRLLNEEFDLDPVSDVVNPILANIGSGDIVPLADCDGENSALTMSGYNPQDVMFTDYCGNVLETFLVEEVVGTGNCDEEGFFMRTSLTWFAIDECGRRSEFSLLLDIVDETAPVFVDTPAEIFVECGEEVPAPIAIDNCESIDVLVISDEIIWEGACEGEYDLQRELIAIDDCGNFVEMTQIVHFIRTQGPEISGIIEEVCFDQLPQVRAFSRCTGEDLEVSMTEVVSTNDCAQGTLTTRTWTAVDDCGNFTEIVQRVYSDDFEAPALVWANNEVPTAINGGEVTLNCGSGDNSTESIDENSVVATNECSVDVQMSITEVPSSCLTTGFIARQEYQWVVTDPCGNQSTFALTVNLVDETAPEFVNAPQDTTLFCAGLPPAPNVFAVDGCSNVTIDYNQESLDSDRFEVQRFKRTWTATDACGNQRVASQIINLEEKPDFRCEFLNPEMPLCNKKDNEITVRPIGGRAPYTYLWSIEGIACEIVAGQGTSQITYRYGFSAFRIKVTIIDADGCVTECSIELECDPTVTNTLNEGELNNAFTLEIKELFPNPTAEDLFVEYATSENNMATLRVVDALGREVRREKVALEKGKHILHQHVKNLQPGYFHIELISHDQVETRRFLKH